MTKKICTFFLVLLYFIPARSQSYLNESCAWYCFNGDLVDDYLHISKYEINGDTIINGTTYWKLFQFLEIYWGAVDTPYMPPIQVEFIRDEGGVFYKWDQTEEDTIISFNLAVGDTIYFDGWFPLDIVSSVDSFEIGGEYRKIFNTTTWGYTIYEGVGTNFGVAEGFNFIGDESFGYMRCFSKDGETVQLSSETLGFEQIEFCDSVLMTSAKHIPYPTNSFSVFPNPTTAKFQITNSIDLEHAAFKLFDTSGRIQNTNVNSVQSNTVEFDFSPETPPGIYFLSIEQQGRVHWEKVVKQ